MAQKVVVKKKKKPDKKDKAGQKSDVEEVTIPSIDDILPEEEEVEEEPTQLPNLTLNYLMKKDKDRVRLVRETIKIMPELAKSDNPISAIMLEKLLEGGKAGGSDVEELKDIAKAMTYTVVLPELMKDVLKSVKGGSVDSSTTLLLKAIEERDKRLHQLITELKEERTSKMMDDVRREMYEAMNQLVETFSNSLKELQQQIAAIRQAPQSDGFDAIDKIIEMEEKAKKLLEKRGYKILDHSAMLEKLKESGEINAEKEIELRKLKIQEKEVEAKNRLYDYIGQAVAKFAENPENILRLINGIVNIFKGGVSNENLASAMRSMSDVTKGSSVIPSLDEFIGDNNAGGK